MSRQWETPTLTIGVYGDPPKLIFNQWLVLTAGGTLREPAADDGFTSIGAPTKTLGHYSNDADALAAINAWVEYAVSEYRKFVGLDRPRQPPPEPATQPDVDPAAVAEVCAWWQSGRDGGSSLLRAGSRCLTGEPHYFTADFITTYEQSARKDAEVLRAAATLLRCIYGTSPKTAAGWSHDTGMEQRGFAGRGLQADQQKDEQIAQALESGQIVMPLWGVSLDRSVAVGYGTKWLLQIDGDFPGVAAWTHSGEKAAEQEIIASGKYDVQSIGKDGDTIVVHLNYAGPVGDRVSTDPLLLDVMTTAAEVVTSSLNRDGGGDDGVDRMKLGLTEEREVSFARKTSEPDSVRASFRPPVSWADLGDDDDSTYNNWLSTCESEDLPADLDRIREWFSRILQRTP